MNLNTAVDRLKRPTEDSRVKATDAVRCRQNAIRQLSVIFPTDKTKFFKSLILNKGMFFAFLIAVPVLIDESVSEEK